jgi:hypothetical protein
VEKDFNVSFRNQLTGKRHVGRFHLVDDNLFLVTGTNWFSVTGDNAFTSIGQWPPGTGVEQVVRGWQVNAAVEQLAKAKGKKQLPASFRERGNPPQDATMSMSGQDLIITFGRNDKRIAYETKPPFRRKELASPAALEEAKVSLQEMQQRIIRTAQISETRNTNILRMLEKEPLGVTANDGYFYQLSDDGKMVKRTSWNRKSTEEFTLDEFNEMEQLRLGRGKGRSQSPELGMTR